MAEQIFDLTTNPLKAAGVLGFLAYMASFALLQARVVDGNGPVYALLNVIAAALVLVSLADAFNLASLLIQLSWIVIGLGGLASHFWMRRPGR